ncbi:unnamed protein product [Urochloa decumbens]|uniref:DUF1618 domain-containing protein n=1 Tax=Urochloa decumbens TaxID=240449 RepID=A0ABC8YM13_9POAL
MDAAACSPRGLMVLSSRLVVHLPNVSPGPEWVPVRCASKEAYGCGELGERILYGLNLLVRRVGYPNLNSSLSMDLSYGALHCIQEDLGVPDYLQGLDGDMPRVEVMVQIAKAQVLVILLSFRLDNFEKRSYHLVYDATDASLYMIPYISSDLETTYTLVPVPARPAGGGGRGHELALAARKFWLQPGGAERGRLCVCTPATRAAAAASPAAPDDGGIGAGPWETKVHGCSQKLPQLFRVDVMFSSGDKVFWADLSQGVAYSDLRQGGSVVDVVFVKLPDGCQIDLRSLPKNVQIDPMNMSRTMGCVHGSIKFVCIDRGVTPPGNKIVKAWTLDLDRQEWKEDEGFTCPWEELWTKMCAMNASRLKDVPILEPQYPVLMPDGALCFLMPRARHKWGTSVKRPDYICSFDMLNKSCMCFGYVRNHHIIRPVVLPSDFFKGCNPAPLKKKPPTRKRKLPVRSIEEKGAS